MSNALSIAAVTATLRDLIDKSVGAGIAVTALPLDQVSEVDPRAQQLNLFLYQVLPNAAWRNMDVPSRARPGETGRPPLALTLRYLLTAYGDSDFSSHQSLGRAMLALHENCLLGADQIRNASSVPVAGNDLHRQAERVRLTLQPLSLEDMSKLWPGFQTSYRLSVAYEASVVLIESAQPPVAPLPVLTRDIRVVPDLNPFPAIESAVPPADPSAVRLGEVLTLRGAHLGGAGVVRFSAPPQQTDWDLPPAPNGTDFEVRVALPITATDRPAGVYSVSVVFDKGGPRERATNAVAVALAPKVTAIDTAPAPPTTAPFSLTVRCKPDVGPEQRVALLIGGRQILADARAAPTDSVTFSVPALKSGTYPVRLRVDGVDSVLVDRSDPARPRFDPAQQIVVA